MKNFKILSLALLAMLATTSCESKDDEDNDGGASGNGTVWVPEKVVYTQDGDTETYLYTYDSMNRIERISEESSGYYTDFEYLDGSIIANEEGVYRRVYNLENGLVKSYGGMQFSYNSNNELIRCEFELEGMSTEYIWSGGLLTKMKLSSAYENSVGTIEYSNNADIAPSCVKYLNSKFLSEMACVDEAVWLNGNLGKVPTKPLSKAISEAYDAGTTWSYSDINSDGCPQTVTMTNSEPVIKYSITWRKL